MGRAGGKGDGRVEGGMREALLVRGGKNDELMDGGEGVVREEG